MHDIPEILASRLNFDVAVFRGHSRQECFVIAIMSLIFSCSVLSIMSRVFVGMWMIGVGLSFPVSIGVGWCLATILQKLKGSKPKGTLKQQIRLQLDRWGIWRSPYIRYSGRWSTRRRW